MSFVNELVDRITRSLSDFPALMSKRVREAVEAYERDRNQPGFVAKVDVLDLIIQVLKEHETKLDGLVERLEKVREGGR